MQRISLYAAVIISFFALSTVYSDNIYTVEDIHRAVKLNDADTFGKILEEQPSLAHENFFVTFAVECNSYDILKLLLEKGANPNGSKYGCNDTPLHKAADNKYVDIVRLLLIYGAEPNIQERTAARPSDYLNDRLSAHPILNSAIMCLGGIDEDTITIVNLLFKYGVHADPKNYEGGDRPLHKAAQYGSVEIIEILLTHGAQLNPQGSDGYTALHYASTQGETNVIKLLLDKGANRYIKDDLGDIPADSAKNEETRILLKTYIPKAK